MIFSVSEMALTLSHGVFRQAFGTAETGMGI
jgi:hypothetical protein